MNSACPIVRKGMGHKNTGKASCSRSRSRVAAAAAVLIAALLLVSCGSKVRENVVFESRLSNLLQLRTYEQVYRVVGYVSKERTVLFFRTIDRQLLYSINIHVQAGIDVAEGIKIFSSSTNTGEITVQLPPARILLADADEESIHQYFSRERGGAVSMLEYGDQIESIKRRTVDEAIRRGILVRAEENARAIVRTFFQSSGNRSVRFSGVESTR